MIYSVSKCGQVPKDVEEVLEDTLALDRLPLQALVRRTVSSILCFLFWLLCFWSLGTSLWRLAWGESEICNSVQCLSCSTFSTYRSDGLGETWCHHDSWVEIWQAVSESSGKNAKCSKRGEGHQQYLFLAAFLVLSLYFFTFETWVRVWMWVVPRSPLACVAGLRYRQERMVCIGTQGSTHKKHQKRTTQSLTVPHRLVIVQAILTTLVVTLSKKQNDGARHWPSVRH